MFNKTVSTEFATKIELAELNAWLGIEAPVPGIMAPSYDLDFQICQAMVKDGINREPTILWPILKRPLPR